MHKLIISAPFGNWLNFQGATSTLGSYTRKYRGGTFKKILRYLLTVRYYWRLQSGSNKLQLPNEGIDSLCNQRKDETEDKIVSIYGFNQEDWIYLANAVLLLKAKNIELNLSCPNVNNTQVITNVLPAVDILLHNGKIVIAKVSPIRWRPIISPLVYRGVRYFHLCNTMYTPGGGLSGKVLKPYSIWAVEDTRQWLADRVIIIGGGGITSRQDIYDYIDAGANHVAIASTLQNPLNWLKVKDWVITANSYNGKTP